jgi:polygalacturonase
MLRREFLFVSHCALGIALSRNGFAALLQAMKNVLDYGATPDGKTMNTASIQRAIDDAFRTGGGTLYVPAGTFLTGRIDLKSRVGLYLAAGCTLLGSKSLSDYHGAPGSADASQRHLIYARDAEEVTLAGSGRIAGQGSSFWEPSGRAPLPPEEQWADVASHAYKEKKSGRPSPMIRFANCRKVHVEGVRLENSPGWTLHLINCDDVEITGMSIKNPIYGPNTDGIDMTGCQNVQVSGCTIETGDDAICLKSENPFGPEPRLIKNGR